MEKSQYEESCSLDTYRVDRNEIGKPSGLWQLMQEAASNQMATQKPSYTDLVDAGKALMLARVDLAIPEQIGLKEALISSSWPCPSTRATFFRNYTLQRGAETVAFAATQWSLVDLASRKILKVEDVDFSNSREQQFIWLKKQGFEVVEYKVVTSESLDEAMDYFSKAIVNNDFPSDGLVVTYDDIAYGESLGSTAKFPRNSFAFKWADEMRETRLVDMEWSPSRTGLINPVAIFEPVELEGTTVSRASVHNISIVKELQLGIGDTIKVYKANMIIPQIAENLTRSSNLVIPDKCPVCGQEARIRKENDVETLYCMNPDCVAKKIKSFSLFTSRDAMNIDGLSEATLEKFIAMGFIHNFGDIFEIGRYKDQIVEMEGFGQKSFDNLMVSLEKAKETTLAKVIYSLGITGIGLANAKVICKYFDDDIEKIRHAEEEEISSIEGIGPVIAGSLADYFKSAENNQKLDHLLSHLHLVHEETSAEQVFAGKTFVITGSVEHFSNRSEAKEFIEARGGKVTGSVTKKTDYLINNDKTSASSKNKKAQELGIPILSEEDFLELAGV